MARFLSDLHRVSPGAEDGGIGVGGQSEQGCARTNEDALEHGCLR